MNEEKDLALSPQAAALVKATAPQFKVLQDKVDELMRQQSELSSAIVDAIRKMDGIDYEVETITPDGNGGYVAVRKTAV